MTIPNEISRRRLVSFLGSGALGLTAMGNVRQLCADESYRYSNGPLAPKAPHFKPRAKRLIWFFMNGGPSHLDTFDPKPALEKYDGTKPPGTDRETLNQTGVIARSPFTFKRYGRSGIEVSELCPWTGSCIDDICVIRSLHTDLVAHEQAQYLMNNGSRLPQFPALGSWLVYALGSENQDLPGYITLCPSGPPPKGKTLWNNGFLPSPYQGCYVNPARRTLPYIDNKFLSSVGQRRQLDLLRSLNERHLEQRDGVDDRLAARIHSIEQAYRMKDTAVEAMDISQESDETRVRYGNGAYAQMCLLARRLSERGVRILQLFHSTNAGDGWDSHAKNDELQTMCTRQTDQPISALLRDLKERGLLDETLVVWSGEFGRTPVKQGSDGRDHNRHGFSIWMAGGGVKRGMVYGATDELGYDAVENRMHVHDMQATILHLFGLDHERLTYRYSGRDFRLTDVYGNVAKAIIT